MGPKWLPTLVHSKADNGMQRQTALRNLLQNPCKTLPVIIWQAEMWLYLPRKECKFLRANESQPPWPYNRQYGNSPIETLHYDSTRYWYQVTSVPGVPGTCLPMVKKCNLLICMKMTTARALLLVSCTRSYNQCPLSYVLCPVLLCTLCKNTTVQQTMASTVSGPLEKVT